MRKQPEIETYYDIGCSECTKHRSTDFSFGMETSRKALRRRSKHEGWVFVEGRGTLCPECARKPYDAALDREPVADPFKQGNYYSVGVMELLDNPEKYGCYVHGPDDSKPE